MNTKSIWICPFFQRHGLAWLGGAAVISLLFATAVTGQFEGFSEPFLQIDLSSDEAGAISELRVEEGSFVDQNDVICKLDSSVQEIQYQIAKQTAESTSAVWAAEQAFLKRQSIHQRLQALKQDGHATDSELLRSDMELSIAQARFLSAKEEAQIRTLEQRRAMIQLDRRTVRAPFSGVVSKVHKRAGEFLSPLHPEIVTLIQVDRLLARFNVPSTQIGVFSPGKSFQLQLVDGTKVEATVFSVGVFTEAQSGTVEIKLVIENQNLNLRSGEFLVLEI
jgi:RND family efflux transporter MFP subunit